MADTNIMDNIKSKITWKNKTIYGAFIIILGIILSLIDSHNFPLILMIIWMIPAICLVIPEGAFKNNRIFGFICLVFDLLILYISASSLFTSYGMSDSTAIISSLFSILLIIASFMMTVKTENEDSSENGSESSSSLKNRISSENKTVFGAILIVLGLIFFGICPSMGLLSILVISIPAICLVIPSETLKNSKAFGIILILLLLFIIYLCITGISSIEHQLNSSMVVYAGDADGIFAYYLQIFLSILNIIGAFLMTIPTVKKGSSPIENDSVVGEAKESSNIGSKANFCKYCGEKLDNDSKFCPSCGKEI